MAKLVWNKSGEKTYETGVKDAALFVVGAEGTYGNGIAWDGITSVAINPEGAEITELYADDTKYLNLISNENINGTIEAYKSPKEFDECDGAASLAAGVSISQQSRKTFGFVFKTTIGNDLVGTDYGYKLHFVYGCLAQPSERSFSTINDNPEAMTLSWEFKTTPVAVTGKRPTSVVTVDSTLADPAKLAKLEALVYGSDEAEATLPTPDEIAALFAEG